MFDSKKEESRGEIKSLIVSYNCIPNVFVFGFEIKYDGDRRGSNA